MTERPVVKRTARAILLDGDDLVLIKRTKPGVDPYWLTPGGGVEPEDATVVDALHREVDEELGAKIIDVVPCFVDTVEHIADGGVTGVKVQHFFVCLPRRWTSPDGTARRSTSPAGSTRSSGCRSAGSGSPPSTSYRSPCATIWTATSRAYGRCTRPTWADRPGPPRGRASCFT